MRPRKQPHTTKRGPGRIHVQGHPRKRRRFYSASEQRRYEFAMRWGPHQPYHIPGVRRHV